MNESTARKVVFIRALEEIDPELPKWTESEAANASREAVRQSNTKNSFDDFLEHRAKHAFKHLHPLDKAIEALLSSRFWSARWILWAMLLGIFFGIIVDSVGSSQKINLLYPPMFAVIAWNFIVYFILIIHFFKPSSTETEQPGILIGTTQTLLSYGYKLFHKPSPHYLDPASEAASDRFLKLWFVTPLTTSRAAGLLHGLAAGIGIGLVAGLYFRGLVFDYRASWESTFLSAQFAHTALSAILWPAMTISNIQIPDVASFESLRVVHGSTATGVSAASWIHLYSLSLILFVVIPRLALMLWNTIPSNRAAQDTLPLGDQYFQRLRDQHSGDIPPQGIVLGLYSHDAKARSSILTVLSDGKLSDDLDRPTALPLFISNKAESISLLTIPAWDDLPRIVNRLQASESFIGRYVFSYWDRHFDKPFWEKQKAILRAKNDVDVIYFCVSAQESPETFSHQLSSSVILDWANKPVIVALMHFGVNQNYPIGDSDINRWRQQVKSQPLVKEIIQLTTHIPGWAQESSALPPIQSILRGERGILFNRLVSERAKAQESTFNISVQLIADFLTAIAFDSEAEPKGDNNKSSPKSPNQIAQEKLSNTLSIEILKNTKDLLSKNGFSDRTFSGALSKLSKHVVTNTTPDTKGAVAKGGLIGAAISGALTGLTADIMSGGLTLGTGALAGAVGGLLLGTVAGASIAQSGFKLNGRVAWSSEALNQLLRFTLLRYLAVLHLTVDVNEEQQKLSLATWEKLIDQNLSIRNTELSSIWLSRESTNPSKDQISLSLVPILSDVLSHTINSLYPTKTSNY